MSKRNRKTNGQIEAHAEASQPTVTIQGIVFEVPTPYVEGHPLTAIEAVVLNQCLAENLRNNFADRVKALKSSGDIISAEAEADIKAKFAEYAAAYEFHGRRQGSRRGVDPVVKEARKIARHIVSEQARKKNIDLKSLAEGRLDSLVSQLLERNPAIMDEAKTRVESAKRVAQSGMEELFTE